MLYLLPCAVHPLRVNIWESTRHDKFLARFCPDRLAVASLKKRVRLTQARAIQQVSSAGGTPLIRLLCS